MDRGTNSDALELGRKLVALFEPYDIVGQWMAHHLAQLIAAASDDEATTVEQREQIVRTIIYVWDQRRTYPGRHPLDQFDAVFAALAEIDTSRWPFSAYSDPLDNESFHDGSATAMPLLQQVKLIRRLGRDACLALAWVAIQDAKAAGAEWLTPADKIEQTIESEVYERLRTAVGRRTSRLVRRADSPVPEQGDAVELIGEPKRIEESDTPAGEAAELLPLFDEQAPSDAETRSPATLDPEALAARLRALAAQLEDVAATITRP